MGTFITGPDPLPTPKTNQPGHPPSGLPYELDAADWNAVWAALDDTRTALATAGITTLTGDVTATGSGSVAATVVSVGGSTATLVHAAELIANAATSLNTASAAVRRDSSGNFSAGAITAASFVGPLTGNVTGNASGSSASFTGSLAGDVTGTQGATAVALVGGSTAALVHAAELLANAATAANTASAIVKRDGTGNVAVQSVTFPDATVQTTAPAALTLTAVGSSPNANAASVVSGALNLQPASASFPGVLTTGAQTIAGAKTFSSAIIANLTGNASGSAGSFTGSLAGDVTGTQGATVVALVGGSTAANVHTSQLATAAATAAATASTLALRDGSAGLALAALTATTGAFSGAVTGISVNLNSSTLGGQASLKIKVKTGDAQNLILEGTGGVITPSVLFIHSSDTMGSFWNWGGDGQGYGIGRGGEGATIIISPGYPDAYLKGHPSSAGKFHLQTHNGTSYQDAIVLVGGNVLIGTSTTDGVNKLQVTGNAVVSGNITSASITSVISSPGGIAATALANPTTLTLAATTGTLTAGTKYYRLAAKWNAGVTLACAEVSQVVGASSGVILTWPAITNATGYRIYGRGTGAETFMVDVGAVTTWTDDGSVTPVPSNAVDALPQSFNMTGGVSMPGSQSYTSNGGVIFDAPNVDVTCAYPFVYRVPAAFTGSIFRIFAIRKGTTDLAWFDTSGGLNLSASLQIAAGGTVASGSGSLQLAGAPADSSTAVGAWIQANAGTTMVTTGARIFSFRNMNGAFGSSVNGERAYVDKGGLVFGQINSPGTLVVPQISPPGTWFGGNPAQFVTTAGTLVAGTYYYRVTALGGLPGSPVGESLPCTEFSKTTVATGGLAVFWPAVPGASGYRVYGRTTGAEQLMATITNPATCSWTDDGSVTPSGALPTVNTTGHIFVAGKRIDTGATNASGTPGAATQNSATGKSAIAAGASSVTITNALCTANSLVAAWIQGSAFDATLTTVITNPAAGSFSITGNAAATAAVTIAWEVLNN